MRQSMYKKLGREQGTTSFPSWNASMKANVLISLTVALVLAFWAEAIPSSPYFTMQGESMQPNSTM